jgi:hypothetical protein
MMDIKMRRNVKLCRLFERPDVTLWYVERYGKKSACNGYSSAQRKLLFRKQLRHFQNSDYSSAQLNPRRDQELWPSRIFSVTATVRALLRLAVSACFRDKLACLPLQTA